MMPRILVIDDDSQFREMMAATLEVSGFVVDHAGDGQEGLDMARKRLPDLVLCDVRMPVLDGYGTLELFRQDPALASIPFILMTGHADDDGARRSAILGVDEYLPKPFLVSDLVATIHVHLLRRRREGHKRKSIN
jgi:two-component system sensor histidine kinase/response regulator